MQTATDKEIAALLSQTGAAHGEYEERALGGAYDQTWPDWYAAHLLEHGLVDLIPGGRIPNVDELAALLRQSDEASQREPPANGWPAYYAGRIAQALA